MSNLTTCSFLSKLSISNTANMTIYPSYTQPQTFFNHSTQTSTQLYNSHLCSYLYPLTCLKHSLLQITPPLQPLTIPIHTPYISPPTFQPSLTRSNMALGQPLTSVSDKSQAPSQTAKTQLKNSPNNNFKPSISQTTSPSNPPLSHQLSMTNGSKRKRKLYIAKDSLTKIIREQLLQLMVPSQSVPSIPKAKKIYIEKKQLQQTSNPTLVPQHQPQQLHTNLFNNKPINFFNIRPLTSCQEKYPTNKFLYLRDSLSNTQVLCHSPFIQQVQQVNRIRDNLSSIRIYEPKALPPNTLKVCDIRCEAQNLPIENAQRQKFDFIDKDLTPNYPDDDIPSDISHESDLDDYLVDDYAFLDPQSMAYQPDEEDEDDYYF